jgi:hypothetical protein
MTIPLGSSQQFQIPVPNFVQNIQSDFVDGFINVATVIAIIGIAASIFSVSPVLGVLSGLMLGVCLIAKSAREDASGRQTAETALRQSETTTRQEQKDLVALQGELKNIRASESQKATLIQSLNDKISEQSAVIKRVTASETELKDKLHKANELEKQIEGTCEEFRKAITKLQTENAGLKGGVKKGDVFGLFRK